MKERLTSACLRYQEQLFQGKLEDDEIARRQVDELLDVLSHLLGSDKMVLKATKLGAVKLLRAEKLRDRALALKRLVYEDPTITFSGKEPEYQALVADLAEKISEMIAKRTLEEKVETRVSQKLLERHEEYVNQIRMQVLNEYNPNPENAQTLKRLAILEKMNISGLASSAKEVLRPQSLDEVVGQERGVKSLLAKMSSPYPQHVIVYGPPGVGKTSAARLVLDTVRGLEHSPFQKNAPFVEVDGATLRWDPRDVTNPLLGSVHDPIYQGARKDFADTGVPEPKLGLVTEAHGGVLFIDEIGEMDAYLQNKLLKVLEDKRVFFDSAYFDAHDANVPQYIKKLFEEGAPADFILIGATTRDPQEISPAIRSRCAEVYFEPLTPGDIEKIVINAATKLKVKLQKDIPHLISEYTIEGRKANNILADAYGLALYRLNNKAVQPVQPGKKQARPVITTEDVYEVIQVSRLSPYVNSRGSDEGEVGRIFGLGVSGFLGSILEIEAVAFSAPTAGTGKMRFNDTAGSMAKDSLFNASSVLRKLTGEDLLNYDLHVNIIGGGRIDGPSAGLAISMAIYSALTSRKLRQDTAVTGELSIQGRIKAVGGIFEKIYGAKQAGMARIVVPLDNKADIPANLRGIEVITVKTVEEALEHLLMT